MAWLEGKYDENGQPMHECAMPWVLIPNLTKGSVWRCGECGKAWRYSGSQWHRVEALDEAVG